MMRVSCERGGVVIRLYDGGGAYASAIAQTKGMGGLGRGHKAEATARASFHRTTMHQQTGLSRMQCERS
jgi:hypothetical protein